MPESVSRFNEIGEHMLALASEMNRLERATRHYRRFPDWMSFSWFRS
jgi:hypothetical protein